MRKSKLRNYTERGGQWLRLSELPFGKTLAYDLIEQGILFSVVAGRVGTRRGVRLISKESLDGYLNSLAVKPEKEVAV